MDDDFKISDEARQRYISRRQKDLESLRIAMSSQSFAEFKNIGHQLKGNAATFGYEDLEKVAIQLEAAGETGDAKEAAVQLALFEQWLSKVSTPNLA